MEFSKLSTDTLRSLKVGDVVRMNRANASEVIAPIAEVEHLWGTDAIPRVTLEGHDPNWTGGVGEEINFEACRQAGAHMVLEIIERAPYRCDPRPKRNIFREQMDRDMTRAVAQGRTELWFHARNGAPKGQLRGAYSDMEKPFFFALGKLPYEITTAFHKGRAMKLWAKAGYPGLVRRPDNMKDLIRKEQGLGCSIAAAEACNEHWFVHEKQFCRFVRQNWSKLIMTKAEMNKDADDFQEWERQSYDRDMAELHSIEVDDDFSMEEQYPEVYQSQLDDITAELKTGRMCC